VNRGARALALGTSLTLAGLGGQLAAQAAADPRRMPPPPASPVEHHDPDQQTCQPQALLQAWSLQLRGYADQPEAVLQKLRALQRELATASLNRCIQRGLLSQAEARQLAQQMGLEGGGGAAPSDPASSQRP